MLSSLSRNQKIGIGVAGALVVVLLAVVLLTSGGGGDDEATTTTTSSTSTSSTTTTAPPVAPLTGVREGDEARRNRPAMLVKVDNTPKAMAVQEGLEKADVVFVEQVEEGVTRLAAAFQSEDATVGPVRSARSSDLAIGSLLGAPYIVYSGANPGVLGEVRGSAHLIDMGIDQGVVTPVYQRNQRGSGLLRYFLPTADVYGVARDGAKTPPQLFQYLEEGAEPTGEAAAGVRIGYAGRSATVVNYDWDGSGWKRSQYDRPHESAGAGQLAPANVVVLFADYRPSGYVDTTGAMSPEVVLEGEGEVWFLTGGTVSKGRWSHPGPDAPITFTGADGQPLRLQPGKTWVELAPGVGSATLK